MKSDRSLLDSRGLALPLLPEMILKRVIALKGSKVRFYKQHARILDHVRLRQAIRFLDLEPNRVRRCHDNDSMGGKLFAIISRR